MKKTIYIISSGNVLRKTGKRLLLEKKQQRIFEIPCEQVGRVLIYGKAEITSQTISALLKQGIPVFYAKRSGRLMGKLLPEQGNQIHLRCLQYQKFQRPEFALPLAISCIYTKINNMQIIVKHLMQNKQGTTELCAPFQKAAKRLLRCHSREEIMGVEGAAARHYFSIYGQHFSSEFQFAERSRRPAVDPMNALLNLGYMTLYREIIAHIEAHGLDPYLGFLHATEERRQSLALDLLEEFRQAIIDLFLFRLLSKKSLKIEDFHSKKEGVELTEDGFAKFFRLFEEYLGQKDGDQPGLRKLIDEQVISLKKHLKGEEKYKNFQITLT